MDSKLTIYILSDSIGETGELLARAALGQFDITSYKINRIPFITNAEQIEEVFIAAKDTPCVIFYTIVIENLKLYINDRGAKLNIPTVDLMTPALNAIEKVIRILPKKESGIIRKLDENYFRKVEAVEFAVKFDDGKDPRGIERADIVLVGVSRTSKTPLSMYLAHKNFKVANVPLVPEVPPPNELFKKDNRRVIGLIANSLKLNEIRQERLKALGLESNANYANIDRINQELNYSKHLMQNLTCLVVDVSYKAIEETAGIVIDYIMEQFGEHPYLR